MQAKVLLILDNNRRLIDMKLTLYRVLLSENFKQKFITFRNRMWKGSPFKLDD